MGSAGTLGRARELFGCHRVSIEQRRRANRNRSAGDPQDRVGKDDQIGGRVRARTFAVALPAGCRTEGRRRSLPDRPPESRRKGWKWQRRSRNASYHPGDGSKWSCRPRVSSGWRGGRSRPPGRAAARRARSGNAYRRRRTETRDRRCGAAQSRARGRRTTRAGSAARCPLSNFGSGQLRDRS